MFASKLYGRVAIGANGLITPASFGAPGDLTRIIVETTPSFWRIRVPPGGFMPSAYEQLVAMLAEGEPARIAIEQGPEAGGLIEVLTDVDDAVACLSLLRAGTGGREPWQGYNANPQSVERLRQPGRPRLSQAHILWRARRGKLSRQTIARFGTDPQKAPFLLTRIMPDAAPVIATVPPPARFWGTADPVDLVGKTLADFFDRPMADAVSRSFDETSRRGVPLFETIETAFVAPGRSRVRTRYDRLVLPWQGDDGARYVSCTVHVRVERFSAADAAEG